MYKRRQPLRDTVTHWVPLHTNIQNIVNEQASFQMCDKLDNKLFIDLGNIIYMGVGENINQFIHEA